MLSTTLERQPQCQCVRLVPNDFTTSLPHDFAMSDVESALSLAVTESGTFVWEVPDGWQQGRGAWGGLSIGALVRAILAAQSDAKRAIRSISCQIFAPVEVGTHSIVASLDRRGSAMSTWSAKLIGSSGEACVQMTAITGVERILDGLVGSHNWPIVSAPTIPPWQGIPVLRLPDFAPAFSHHIEQRLVEGIPLSGAPAKALGWVRFPGQGHWSGEQLLAIVDAWWPTVLAPLPAMRPMATVNFAAHLLVDPTSIPVGEPLIFESFMTGLHDGFVSETRRLWTADGRLAVENLQSIALIR